MRKFNYVASKNDMTGEFNEWQKTEIKIWIWICVAENDPHPEVYDHILVRQRGIKNVNHVLTLGVHLLPTFQQRVAKRWHSQEKELLKLNQPAHSRVWTVITEKTARSRICSQRQATVIFVKQSVSSVSSVTAWMRLYFANMGTLALRLKGLTQC